MLVFGSLLYSDSTDFSAGFARERDLVLENVDFLASLLTLIGLCAILFEGMDSRQSAFIDADDECSSVNEE